MSPTSTVSDADTVFSRYSSNSLALTVVTPDLISKYERDFYYHGLSGSPPPLLWRSDLEESPFPVPAPGDRYFSIPVKTAHDAIGTPLAAVWPTVGPAIVASLKSRGIKYTAVKPVRFSLNSDEHLGPAVVWIAIPPKSSEAGTVRDATPDILGEPYTMWIVKTRPNRPACFHNPPGVIVPRPGPFIGLRWARFFVLR